MNYVFWLIILIIILSASMVQIVKANETIARKVYNRLNRIAIKYDATNFSQNKHISSLDILAIICVETGHKIDLPNYEVIGDEGRSFGYMQVQAGALADVNNSLKSKYTIDDIKYSAEINLLVGSHYLELCVRQALREKAKDPLFLAYRKYNSGIGKAKETNLYSYLYGLRVKAYKDLFKKLIFEKQI